MKDAPRYVILSDLHIPDHDEKSLALVMRFIADFKPDFIYLLGDQVNFTKISKYEQDPRYHVDLADEIKQAKKFLAEITKVGKRANRNVQFVWFDGNHEARLVHWLNKNAANLAELEVDDMPLVSIQNLLELKKLGIRYVAYPEVDVQYEVAFTHGQTIRSKSGYTGHANMEKYGRSGFSGHTHRMSFTSKTQMGKTKWWIETGCLCNLAPTPSYTNYPDWMQGFAIAEYDPETEQLYGAQIPIVDHSFRFNGKTYK